MNRRQFIYTGAGFTAATHLLAEQAADQKTKRVGMIGCGWYGKTDLFRLIQVAPVEVVSLCDVDSKMLSDAADMTATRQASKHRPRTYGDYRKMLAEKDLDIVLVGTPDHWHALAMIAAVEAGADVWCQKPISVDVREGQAMLASARKHGRVVQIGTQRRSTPHLVDALNKVVKPGKLGKWGWWKCTATITCAPPATRQTPRRLPTWTTKCGPAPRPCARTIPWCIREAGARLWSTATESWATCASTCSI